LRRQSRLMVSTICNTGAEGGPPQNLLIVRYIYKMLPDGQQERHLSIEVVVMGSVRLRCQERKRLGAWRGKRTLTPVDAIVKCSKQMRKSSIGMRLTEVGWGYNWLYRGWTWRRRNFQNVRPGAAMSKIWSRRSLYKSARDVAGPELCPSQTGELHPGK
jgi:hypothetical protein